MSKMLKLAHSRDRDALAEPSSVVKESSSPAELLFGTDGE